MTDTNNDAQPQPDPISAKNMLLEDAAFMARLTSPNSFISEPARKVWDRANEQAAIAETAAAKTVDDNQRDGSPDPEPIAYQVEPGMLLANQVVDEPTLTFAQEVAAGLKLSKEEWNSVAVSWSGALAALDRGDAPADAEAGIRQLAQRYGIEEADRVLADARSFIASVPKDKAAQVQQMLEGSGLANSPQFVERLAYMHRARQGRRR